MVMWVVGNTLGGVEAEMRGQLQAFHVALGSLVLLFLLIRIAWRLAFRHPYLRGQSKFFHRVGVVAHYIILICVFVMLMSGPLMIWFQGLSIEVFDWMTLPSPLEPADKLYRIAQIAHVTVAGILVWLVLIHIAGAFKHYVVNHDETFVRIFWPPRGRPDDGAE
jgi:cytochrome b561